MAGSFDVLETAEAIKTIISDDIVAKLSTLNTAYGDSLTILKPADYRFAPMDEHPDYPALVISVAGQDRVEELDDYTFFEQTAVLGLRVVGMAGTDSSETPASLTPQEVNYYLASRSMRAFKEILEGNRTLTVSSTDNADNLTILGDEFFEVEPQEGREDIFEFIATMPIKVEISGTS